MPPAPKSRPAFPSPAAVLPGEADILAKVIENLADHDAKLVYADWLEERDDPRGPMLREFITAYRGGKKKLPKVSAAPKSWRDLVGITLMMRIRETALGPVADQLLGVAKPAIAFRTVKAPESLIWSGTSKVGGKPDLLPDAKWPKFQGMPLAFHVQINLAEVAVSPVCRDLPASGMLSFFYDSWGSPSRDMRGGGRVIFTPKFKYLKGLYMPDGPEHQVRHNAGRVVFTETVTLPALDSPWLGKSNFASDPEVEAAYRVLPDPGEPGHRLLGHSIPIAGAPPEKQTDCHLLRLGSDPIPGFGWGAGKALYFLISKGNLQKQRFNLARFEVSH